MSRLKSFYPESQYGGFSNVDGTILFYSRVNSLITPSSVVLDVGCGRGEYGDHPDQYSTKLRIFKGKAAKVIGLDVSTEGNQNPYIDEFHMIRDDHWPLSDETVDIIVADWVLEHIEDPHHFFSEANRILKKEGIICIRTSNKWSYVSLIARLIPNRYHDKILSAIQEEREVEDVFPTEFKCNSARSIKKFIEGAAFEDIVVFTHEAEPSYLTFSKFLYWLGTVFHKITPARLRTTIITFARKK